MLDFNFEINGEPVDPNRIGDAIEKAILEGTIEDMKKKLKFVRCKTHGKAPKITFRGKTINKLSFEVSGCCQDLIDQAIFKLK